MGATGQHIVIGKGPSPDRVDQLFGFVTPFMPPVNSTPQVCRGDDGTVVGDFDMSLNLGGVEGNVGRDADSARLVSEGTQMVPRPALNEIEGLHIVSGQISFFHTFLITLSNNVTFPLITKYKTNKYLSYISVRY